MLMRRLDAVMAKTRDAIRKRDAALEVRNKQRLLEIAAKLPVLQHVRAGFSKMIAADATNVARNLRDCINGFSPNVRDVLARCDLDNEISRLASAST